MDLSDHGLVPYILDKNGYLVKRNTDGAKHEITMLNKLVNIRDYYIYKGLKPTDKLYIVEVTNGEHVVSMLMEHASYDQPYMFGKRFAYIGDEETLSAICIAGAKVLHTYIVEDLHNDIQEYLDTCRTYDYGDDSAKRMSLYKAIYEEFDFKEAFNWASGAANDVSYALKV